MKGCRTVSDVSTINKFMSSQGTQPWRHHILGDARAQLVADAESIIQTLDGQTGQHFRDGPFGTSQLVQGT
jgi:hypothetical protein